MSQTRAVQSQINVTTISPYQSSQSTRVVGISQFASQSITVIGGRNTRASVPNSRVARKLCYGGKIFKHRTKFGIMNLCDILRYV